MFNPAGFASMSLLPLLNVEAAGSRQPDESPHNSEALQ
jgi:hypothetical protein